MELLSKIVISKETDFDMIKKQWRRLQQGNEMTYFQSFEWNVLLYREWEKSRYNKLLGKVVVYYTNNIIIPLIIQNAGISLSGFWKKRGIYFLGTGSYSDYLNCVYDNVSEESIKCYFSEIALEYPGYSFYLFYLKRNTVTSNCFEMYSNYLSEVTVAVSVNELPDYYSKTLSKNTRQNLRTALNRMRNQNINYRFEIFHGILDNSLSETLLSIHRKRVRIKNECNGNMLSSIIGTIVRRRVDYYEKNNNIIRYAMKSVKKGITVVVFLNENAAGYLYGFVDGNTIRIVHNCFDESYKFFSPMFRGTYDFLIDCCNNDKISVVDFTRGDEEYKYKLGGKESEIRSFVIKKFQTRKTNNFT